jgi:hypothetical protein
MSNNEFLARVNAQLVMQMGDLKRENERCKALLRAVYNHGESCALHREIGEFFGVDAGECIANLPSQDQTPPYHDV